MNTKFLVLIALIMMNMQFIITADNVLCSWSNYNYTTDGGASSSFCCSQYNAPVFQANVIYNITSDDEYSIFVYNDCKTQLDGGCVDCCSDTNCILVTENQSGTTSGSFMVSGSDCNLGTVSFVYRCNSGLFDTCNYSINEMTINIIEVSDPYYDMCCPCSNLSWSYYYPPS